MALTPEIAALNPSLKDLYRYRRDLMEARFSGVRSLRDTNGEEIVYRSDSELKAALTAINQEIAVATKRPANTIVFNTSKGI